MRISDCSSDVCSSDLDLGMGSVAVYPADDGASLHARKADQAIALPGRGVAAYLDGAAILRAAQEAGATAIHPGYGFLSENAGFARACADAGITFVGPTPERSEEHTSELQSLMRNSYAVFCLKKKKKQET